MSWLQSFTNEPVIHTGYAGATGMGKTQAVRSWLIPMICRPREERASIWLFDAPGTLKDEVVEDLAFRGKLEDVFVDELADNAKTLGYDFQPYSNDEATTKQRIEDTRSMLLFVRDVIDDWKSPNIRDALGAALGSYGNNLDRQLGTRVPLTWLYDALMPEADANQYFIDHCTSKQIADRMRFLSTLRGSQWEYRCGAADRILQDICSDPAFRARDGSSTDWRAAIDRGVVWLGSGKSKDNVSRHTISVIFGFLLLFLIMHARNGSKRKIIVVLEEGQAAALLGPHIGRALLECRKWGLEFHIIIHNIKALPPELQENLIQNIRCWYFFGMASPAAVRHAAEILAIPGLDPRLVKRTRETRWMEHTGRFVEREVRNRGERMDKDGDRTGSSTNTNMVSQPVYEERVEVVEDLYTFEEQIRMYEKALTNLGVGECYVRKDARVYYQKIKMLEKPWDGLMYSLNPPVTLAERKAQLALESIKQRLEYREPSFPSPPPCPPTPSSPSRSQSPKAPKKRKGRGKRM